MTWSQRLQLALDYIEENLDTPLSIEQVAGAAFCSKFHFHRVFFASFNMTCADYIRKRKLTMAAIDIISTKKNIADIALNYGYDSHNAFTRAFKSVHNINPGKVRSSNVTLVSYNRVTAPQDNGEIKMDYKIVQIPEFNVLGTSKTFNFDSFVKEGPSFWKTFVGTDDYQNLIKVTNGRPGKETGSPMLSLYFPKEEQSRDEFVDVLGIESDICQAGFSRHEVPAATYAEFNCTYKTSMKTNRQIYGQWFKATGYERDGNKPDIVAYFPIPFRPMGEMRVRWWIPVVRT